MLNHQLRIIYLLSAFVIGTSFVIPHNASSEIIKTAESNRACEQIASNEFIVNSHSDNSCILWGYVNVKGNVQLDIEKYETDTKVYMWWTTGQFLMKTPIVELTKKTNLVSIPNARKARLNIKTVCGSAKVTLTQKRNKTTFKN